MTESFQLAQLNVARLKAPLASPEISEFVALLDPINAIADAAPGFVWRLQTDEGNSTAVRMLDQADLIVNMSVWESRELLAAYVYHSGHRGVMRRRREWMLRTVEAYLVLWWVPAGHRPTVAEAQSRLLHLRVHGPTPEAFTFRESFPPGPAGERTASVDDRWSCPTG